MKDKRIHNDLNVMWSIFADDAPFSIEGKQVTIYLRTPYSKKEIAGYSISGNVITWKFLGKDQKHTGKHSLELVINENAEGMVTTDACDFVNLVDCSCKVGGADDAGVQTETISLTSNLEYVASGAYDDTAVWEYIDKLEKNKADKTEIPTKVSQLENDADYATKNEIDSKQDEIKDLDAIRSGAAKGATALQSIPAEYVTDDELDNALRPKVNVNQIATINGKSLVNGGNIVITGGEGGGYDDTEIRAELDELSSDVKKVNDITLVIKSNNINTSSIESGGYSVNYKNGTIAPFSSSTTTRCNAPIMFEQGKSIYMILEYTPANMSYITIIPIDINGKPVGTDNVLLYARNKSTHDTVFTPPQGAVGMYFFCSQSQGVTNYKLGLYYTDYDTSIVEDYVPDEVTVNADKLAKNGKRVVYEEKKDADLFKERLGYDKEISEELPAIDNPDAEYAKHLISAVRQEISEIWRWMARKEEVTILDSGVCGENLNWALYSDGLLRISGEGRAYDYCKGLLMDELVGAEYDSLPTMRAKIEKYQSQYIGKTDADSVAKYERGFQEGKIYDDANEQYFAPWYIYRPEKDFIEYEGEYSSKANYDLHNPNGWQYNRIIIDEGVTYLGNWMLYRLCGVSELVIPSSVKAIGQWCIRYSPSLKCVYLHDGIETIERYGCSRLETCEAIRMGDGFTRVEDQAFGQNSCVKSMFLSGNLDHVGTIPFAYNAQMTDISIKGVQSIGLWFTGCDALKRVQLSEGLVTIEPRAFVNKPNLCTINIPSSVTTIGQSAFYNCLNLKIVYIDSPTIAANVINEAGTSSADFLVKNVEYLYINSNIETIGAWILENFTKVNDADGYALYIRNS